MNSKKIKIELYSDKLEILEAESLVLDSIDGSIGVLRNHIPFLTVIEGIKIDGKSYDIEGLFIFKDNSAKIIRRSNV